MTTRKAGEEAFAPLLPPQRLDVVWAELEAAERRWERRRLVRRAVAGTAAVAMAVAVVVVLFVARRGPGPLLTAGGRPLPTGRVALPDGDASALVLSDGSRLTALRSTDLTVIDNDGARLLLQLTHGSVLFFVTPGGPRHWFVETDLATVEVVGTVFRVERGDAGLDVSVEHGIVLVRGEHVPDRMRRLAAGESLHIDAMRRSAAEPAAPPTATPAAEGVDGARAPASGRRSGHRSLDSLLDELEQMRRDGHLQASREALRRWMTQARTPGERATVLLTLAQWTSDDGDDVAAAELLAGDTFNGAPPEIARAARRLESACRRAAGQATEAEPVKHPPAGDADALKAR